MPHPDEVIVLSSASEVQSLLQQGAAVHEACEEESAAPSHASGAGSDELSSDAAVLEHIPDAASNEECHDEPFSSAAVLEHIPETADDGFLDDGLLDDGLLDDGLLDNSQSPFIKVFQSDWLANAFPPIEPAKSLAGRFLAEQQSDARSAAASTRKGAPKTKSQSLAEVCMLMDESVARQFPSIEEDLGTLFGVGPAENVSMPSVAVVSGLGEGVVTWRRRPWIIGPALFRGGMDPFAAFPEACPFRLLFREPEDTCVAALQDREVTVYLAVPRLRAYLAAQKAGMNRAFKDSVSKGSEAPLDIRAQETHWTEWESSLYRQCLKSRVHLMTRLRRSESEKDNPAYLLSELCKSIAWQPYQETSNAGLEFSALTTGRKAPDDPKEVWLRWLLELPRISCTCAEAVAARWPSYSSFVKALRHLPAEDAVVLVASVRVSQDGRQLGPMNARRICSHFLK